MWKNITIIVLLFALAVVVYKYINHGEKINVRRPEGDDNAVAVPHNMKFEEGVENSYAVKSKDGKFWMLFVYDSQGLKLFGLRDYLSGKQINFNFSTEGELNNYSYTDKEYSVGTNVASIYPIKLIDRLEWYKDFRIIYELLPDGTTKITSEKSAIVNDGTGKAEDLGPYTDFTQKGYGR
ncbi:MAG: hypothetical protein LBK08_01580 [Treponema sp.]|nr:hypothetical protein [Treponema sp.]